MRYRNRVTENKGFSLIELIVVIAIMAILVGAISPQLVKYIAKSRRAVDVKNAAEIVEAFNVTRVANDLTELVDGDASPFGAGTKAVGWRRAELKENGPYPKNSVLYYVVDCFGEITDPKTNDDFSWYLVFDSDTGDPLNIYIIDDTQGGSIPMFYEVWPDSSDFLANGP